MKNKNSIQAFSLVEMLMALLVASLLLAALAPVITRRINDSMTISVEGEIPGKTTKIHEIEYDSADCPGDTKVKSDADGSQYCEGEFIVPSGYNGKMKVTVIGAGGGGGVAPTAGYVEYKEAGSTNTFIVPSMVNKLEATLISGGAGGAAGGQIIKTQTFVTTGNGGITKNDNNKLLVLPNATTTWTIPDATKGKNVLVTGCGGGGGAGGGFKNDVAKGGNGGFGNYIQNKVVSFVNGQNTANIFIGGGGGGGGGDDTGTAGTGRPYGGGGGGHEIGTAERINGSAPGGAGGYSAYNTATGQLFSIGGGGDNGVGGNGSIALNDWRGGGGSTGGSGGPGGGTNSEWLNKLVANNGASIAGGAGGGSEGGGGGGAGSSGNGGGGGGATLIKQNGIELFNAGGGGGAGGIGANNITNNPDAIWSGGGGGGGVGGGKGGGGHYTTLNGGDGKSGKTTTIWGGSYCAGGNNINNDTTNGINGNDGAITIKYLSYGTGGSGGGATRLYAIYPVNVAPTDELEILIGKGGLGGTPGKIETDGRITNPIEPTCNDNRGTYIKKDGKEYVNQANSCNSGGYPGNSSGRACGPHKSPYYSEGAWIFSTLGNVWPLDNGMSGTNYPQGFFTTNGRPAGDGPNLNCDANSIAIETSGGRGATVTTPFTNTCTPGKGGTKNSPTGGNASGYGCGGGGGYGLANGGNGSGGYARISWNKYWDTALNSGKGGYKYADIGTAGGGASGNIVTYTIDVKSGERIRFRIGKGGDGASVDNNILNQAKKGGDTIFGYGKTSIQIAAGGGNAGGSASITGTYPNTTIVNGGGGAENTLHTYKNVPIATRCNNTRISDCYIPSIKGNDGENNKGGSGATLERNDKILRANVNNAGGSGGKTGDNATGKAALGYGSGGGGAGILDIGINPPTSTYNPNMGGNGTNGKIILEWWE